MWLWRFAVLQLAFAAALQSAEHTFERVVMWVLSMLGVVGIAFVKRKGER